MVQLGLHAIPSATGILVGGHPFEEGFSRKPKEARFGPQFKIYSLDSFQSKVLLRDPWKTGGVDLNAPPSSFMGLVSKVEPSISQLGTKAKGRRTAGKRQNDKTIRGVGLQTPQRKSCFARDTKLAKALSTLHMHELTHLCKAACERRRSEGKGA